MTDILPIVVFIVVLLIGLSWYRTTKRSQPSQTPEPTRTEQRSNSPDTALRAPPRREEQPAHSTPAPAAPVKSEAPQPQPAVAVAETNPAPAAVAHPATTCGHRAPHASPPAIPQDATLRRHYLTHLASMVEALTFPRPSDSSLRRHYEQLIASKLEECLGDSVKLEQLIGQQQTCAGSPS